MVANIMESPSGRRTGALSAQLANAVVNQTADLVFVTDRNGQIEYVNPSFERVTGYTLPEVMGATPRLLRSGEHDDEFYARMWTALLGGNVFRDTLVNRRKSGELLLLEQTISPIRDRSGRICRFVSVGKDVTEARRASERDQRMELARNIQQRFYPTAAPRIDGIDVAGGSWAADHTGGDYYDYVRLADGGLGLVIADVSGHGFDAALLMAETRAYLRSLAGTCNEPGRLLTAVNRVLASDVPENRFVTMLLVAIDPDGSTFRYANAAHVAGMLIDADGSWRARLISRGRPLGPFADLDYGSSDPIALRAGDTLVLVSDGAVESEDRHGRSFGHDSLLRAVVAAGSTATAHELVLGVRAALMSHTGGKRLLDDLTVVVCRVRQRGGERADSDTLPAATPV